MDHHLQMMMMMMRLYSNYCSFECIFIGTWKSTLYLIVSAYTLSLTRIHHCPSVLNPLSHLILVQEN